MINRKKTHSALSWFSPFLTLALGAFVLFSVVVAEPIAEDRSAQIGKQIRCPACEGESIAESPSAYAFDMMTFVRELVDQGLSDQQVLDRLMASYPDSHLLDPPLRASTILLWLIPAAALIVGVGIALSRLRRGAFRSATGEPR
jgi:cytochrome c-type biogenesis protein CcmH